MSEPPLTFTITDDDSLTRTWETLVGPWGFDERQLWVLFLDAQSTTLPLLMPIDGIPDQPDQHLLDNLRVLVDEQIAIAPGSSVVLLVARPGRAPMAAGDRAWARALTEQFVGSCSHWPVHVANDAGIETVRPDDAAA